MKISGNPNLIKQGHFQTNRLKENKEYEQTISDKTLDLTDLDDIKNQNSDNVKYIKINESGEDVFYSIESIPEGGREGFIKDIQSKITSSSVSPNFDLDDFINLTSEDNLQIGNNQENNYISLSSDVKTSKSVLTDSNNLANKEIESNKTTGTNKTETKKDVNSLFTWANGGRNELKASEVPEEDQVGDQNKPAEWYNFISIDKNNKITVYTHPESKVKGPENFTKKDLEGLIKDNLNLFGNISDIDEIAGQLGKTGSEVFLKALKTNPEINQAFSNNPELLEEIAGEIYSYAKTGHGVDGDIDIAKLQGALKMLHPFIDETAASNTNFDENSKIPRGDGELGRATMLEMRHLLAGIDIKDLNNTPVDIGLETPENDLVINIPPNTDIVIFKDTSGSMTDYTDEVKKQSVDLRKNAEGKGSKYFETEGSFNSGSSENALTEAYNFLFNNKRTEGEGMEFQGEKFALNLEGRNEDSKPLTLFFISNREDNLVGMSDINFEKLINTMKDKNIDIVISNPTTGVDISIGEQISTIVKDPNKKKLEIDPANKDNFKLDSKINYNAMLSDEVKAFIESKVSEGLPLNKIKGMTTKMWFGEEGKNINGQESVNNDFWEKYEPELISNYSKELFSQGKSLQDVEKMVEIRMSGSEKSSSTRRSKLEQYEEVIIRSYLEFNNEQKKPISNDQIKADIKDVFDNNGEMTPNLLGKISRLVNSPLSPGKLY